MADPEIDSAVDDYRADKKAGLLEPGRINREVLSAIAAKIPPSRVAEKIEQLLDAKRDTKHGVVIDTRSVEAGVKLYLAYMVGLPVQRQEILNVNLDADATTGLEERLRNSPALREQMRKLLAAAETVEVSASVEQ